MLRIFISLLAYLIGCIGPADQGNDIENRGFPEDGQARATYRALPSENMDRVAFEGTALCFAGNVRNGLNGEITPCKGLN